MNTGDLLTGFGQFFRSLLNDLTSGLLFFGGPIDIVAAFLDIFATALVVYYILRLLRDSRAWQLLKGLLMIVAFALVCSLFGLTTVGFLLNNTISVFAIAFVVIFQPELRRALETVGRSSFSRLSTALVSDEKEEATRSVHHMIESIVQACEKMAESRTGALIIIERQTKLGEFQEQENAVQLDAAVSSTMLQQIFYKGSPLHDGAVLIRNGRISAARVHVPLSDNYHLRRDFGTRHRAAIGASEIGDTLAIVVSEERGTISLAIEGRLYTLDNADALRSLLHKMLGSPRQAGAWTGIFRPRREETSQPETETAGIPAEILQPETAPAAPEAGNGRRRRGRHLLDTRPKESRRQRILNVLLATVIAIGLWLYVQVTVNPVVTRTFSTPVTYRGAETVKANGFIVQMPLETIQINIMGRKKTVNDLSVSDIDAYVDLSVIDKTGLQSLPVIVDTATLRYTRATFITPSTITVSVRLESPK